MANEEYLTYCRGRIAGMREVRSSWLSHWADLGRYFLPRRYKWVVTANNQSRGSAINEAILDSSGCLALRNLASGLMSGKVSPTQPWFKLNVAGRDATGTDNVGLWLAACERLLYRIYAESNFYTTAAQWLYDLSTFGTAPLLIYPDFDDVITCVNPCAGEYFVDVDAKYRPRVLAREFTMSVYALVREFGIENVGQSEAQAYRDGRGLSREVVVQHLIEPNDDGKDFGVPASFTFREAYWQQGNTSSPETGAAKFLRCKGYHEQPHATPRWDVQANDPYGRSPAMDALPDQKQLQLETKRKAQAIDKGVNPPLVADMQLKNKPASQLPGGMTYISGMMANGGRPGIASIYTSPFPIADLKEDLDEIRERIKYTFFNHLFQPISQYETRSNITAVEINQRKAESLIMLGPVFERLDNEGLRVILERTWAIVVRAGILPPPPPEIGGHEIKLEFVSMLALAQNAANSAGIMQLAGLAAQVGQFDQSAFDKLDYDNMLDIYSGLLNNDPRLMRTADAVQAIRQNRAQQQEAAARAEQAQQLSAAVKNVVPAAQAAQTAGLGPA